jgi:hypothetical protein
MNKAESNRVNALKSTGPKSTEGKAASSKNAIRHGAYSEAVTVLGETLEAFEEMRVGMVEALAPAGALEERLVDRLSSLWWRLERAGRVEREGLAVLQKDFGSKAQPEVADSFVTALNAGWMERLMRYEGQLERSFFKTLHELERIQARRAGDAVPAPAVVDVTVHGIPE